MATTTTMTTLTATMTTATTTTTTTAAATEMAAASATAIAGPQTTINLSYRNGYVELDTTKMFCGEDYEEAATTGTPCPEEDCPEGQTCWAGTWRVVVGEGMLSFPILTTKKPGVSLTKWGARTRMTTTTTTPPHPPPKMTATPHGGRGGGTTTVPDDKRVCS
jgi:hypothetical protein